jgi:hypothetical protein
MNHFKKYIIHLYILRKSVVAYQDVYVHVTVLHLNRFLYNKTN